ncbi:MAG: sigma-70 family RNA polymerase sigma factor [Planctomycetes bacterium]|nr:sigma-70 family RNA polymerase sigma factor [Planctomycetota bacterium]
MATAIFHDTDRVRMAEHVVAAQAGDRGAFGVLYEAFEHQVYAIALRRVRNHTDAQELCQDVFVQALEKLSQLRAPECFGAWIRSIAHRMAINRAVRRAPDVAMEPAFLDAASADDTTPLAHMLAGERCTQLRDGLARLGELDRQTLEAFYVHGRTLLEMSDEFGAPLGTIKRRLHVARKRLAKEVEPLTAI